MVGVLQARLSSKSSSIKVVTCCVPLISEPDDKTAIQVVKDNKKLNHRLTDVLFVAGAVWACVVLNNENIRGEPLSFLPSLSRNWVLHLSGPLTAPVYDIIIAFLLF